MNPTGRRYAVLVLPALLAAVLATPGLAQELAEGSATVVVDDDEYTIRIECDAAADPSLGFSTEPNRITKERTGRQNMVALRLRQWKQTEEVVVSLDRYVAWIDRPAGGGGQLVLTLDMSPSSLLRDGIPVTLTYDMWSSGDRPEGLTGVQIVANCASRDPEAPGYRKLDGEDL